MNPLCNCLLFQDAVLELGNEIRWIDEEGVRARLDAEAVTRTRMDALAARVDAVEDGGSFSKRTDTASSRRPNAGPNTPGSHYSDAAVPRDTLVKHVRVCDICWLLYRGVSKFWAYGSVWCACAQRPGLPRACHSG